MSQAKAKSGAKRTRKTKGQPDNSQRTLRDMFGAKPSTVMVDEPAAETVEVDEEPSNENLSSDGGRTPKEESVIVVSEDENQPESPNPKKPSQPARVFPIFQRLQRLPEPAEQEPRQSPKAEGVIDIDSEPDVVHDLDSADNKAHLGRSTSKVLNPRSQPSFVGHTREDPIVIEQSPEREVPKQPAKALWTLFRRPDSGSSAASSPSTTRQLTKKFVQPGLNLPKPAANSQHVRGPQSSFAVPTLPFTRRDKGKERARDSDLDSGSGLGSPIFLSTYRKLKHEAIHTPKLVHSNITVPSDHDQSSASHISIHAHSDPQSASKSQSDTPSSPEGIPRAHRGYPAIARFSNEAYLRQLGSDASWKYLQWTEKWKPRRADEVLGNEERATYLRDWLVALRLQYDGPKVRAKTKQETGVEVGASAGSESGGGGSSGTSSSQTRKRKIGKVKKPTIIRQVKKRRRIDYDDLDGFVAADDEIEEPEDHMAISDDDLVEFFRSHAPSVPVSAASSPPSSYPSSPPAVDPDSEDESESTQLKSFQLSQPARFGQSIHNTILLAGPNGSGKTAAVYACAEELGWEVFEVYPGIGQRCGPELHRLVGDVGKHHLVNTRRSEQTNSGDYAAPSIFQPTAASSRKSNRQIVLSDDEDQAIPTPAPASIPVSVAPATEEAETNTRVEPDIKQSLILIEEVDVLYQSDTGFWQALIGIIKECRRPVVLTCNDTSLVPFEDLPLQTTLLFDPPQPSLTASYLKSVCEAEGIVISHRFAQEVYENATNSSPASGSRHIPHELAGDLRSCLNQLQLSNLADQVPSSEEANDRVQRNIISKDKQTKRLGMLHDVCSFMESQSHRVHRGAKDTVYFHERNTADEILGYSVIGTDIEANKLSRVSAFYNGEECIADAVTSISRGLLAASDLDVCQDMRGIQEEPILALKSDFAAQMVPIYESCSIPLTTAGQAPLYLDYIPWIRYMVGVDDAVQRLVPASEQSGRRTRNSRRAVEQRYLGHLKEKELEVLAKTAFGTGVV